MVMKQLPNLSEGAMSLVKSYLLGKWQGTDFAERIQAPRTLKDLLAVIQRDFPDDVSQVVRILVGATGARDPYESERRQAILDSARRDGWGYGWQLPSGVSGGPGFDAFSSRDNRTVSLAKAAALQWLSGAGPGIVLLAGGTGTGKTHLAMAAAQTLVEQGQDVLYRTEGALLGEIQGCIRDGTVEDRLAAYSLVPWLIIDDLGVPAEGLWLRGIQDRLIDARWQAAPGLRTLVTTNLKSSQMSARVASRLGDQVRSHLVQISASDFRAHGA